MLNECQDVRDAQYMCCLLYDSSSKGIVYSGSILKSVQEHITFTTTTYIYIYIYIYILFVPYDI